MRDLLIITPTRGRPASIRRLAMSVGATAQADTILWFAIDDDDQPSLLMAKELGCDYIRGARQSPAEWTNIVAGVWHDQYRALASLSDDHVPRTPGWDAMLLNAIDAMDGTGIAYGDDGIMRERLPTAPVISSDIVAALGWMCEPSLSHFCVDNVWKDLGQAAGCLAYVPEVIIEHLHWLNGRAPMDATYEEAGTYSPDCADARAYAQWRSERMADDVSTVRAL